MALCSSTALNAARSLATEVVYVDDGSRDATLAVARELPPEGVDIQLLSLSRNFGKEAALLAGLDHARLGAVLFMDGDGQHPPTLVETLVRYWLDEGYDVVSGWRQDRQDRTLSRRLPSLIANRLASRISGVHLHDYGCTLKAYRRSVIENVRLYGEMHRFIPIYAAWQGGRVAELPVRHHARRHGKSKYGLSRAPRVLLAAAGHHPKAGSNA